MWAAFASATGATPKARAAENFMARVLTSNRNREEKAASFPDPSLLLLQVEMPYDAVEGSGWFDGEGLLVGRKRTVEEKKERLDGHSHDDDTG